jgi:hypothetical protein
MLTKITGKFELGQTIMTPGVLALVAAGFNPAPYLARHAAGDWGDMTDDDKAMNEEGLIWLEDEQCWNGRLHSSYVIHPDLDARLWVITESDRSATTILLPREY